MIRRLPLLVAIAAVVLGLAAGPAAAADVEIQPGLNEIKAPDAWPKSRGQGIRVGVVSSGVASAHQDLKDKVSGSGGGADATIDNDNRGTHLAAIVGAAANGTGTVGVAPDARLLPYKAFDTAAPFAGDHFVAALGQALANRPEVVLVDIPGSLPNGDGAGVRSKIEEMTKAGISVVVGAQGAVSFVGLPVLTVTTTSGGGQGTGVDATGVAAPGDGIRAASVMPALIPTSPPSYVYDYDNQSGTNQAAAHVAGAVAILRRVGADATQAAELLRTTAHKGSAGTGAGTIDVAAAVAAYKPAPPPPTTPTTKKAAATPSVVPGKSGALPAQQPLPGGPTGPNLGGGDLEPGAGENAVTPPGADQFTDTPTEDAPATASGGSVRDRPLGLLTVGFGLLFGVGSGLSITFRRLGGLGL